MTHMYEYWHCLGKALADSELYNRCASLTPYDPQGIIPGGWYDLLYAKGFRLSRFEMGEIYRLLGTADYRTYFLSPMVSFVQPAQNGNGPGPFSAKDSFALIGAIITDGQLRDSLSGKSRNDLQGALGKT